MTIDKSRPALSSRPHTPRGTLPEFAPVPRHYNRHDGWTPERQTRFIEALADTGSVRAAAHAVNMTPEGAYLLRRHPEAHGFRKAWEAALKLGVQRLEDVAMERALNGVEVPVYHFGAVVGARRVYNDRLLMFILRNRATRRFAADVKNLDAATRSRMKRLKAEWRAEWEAEQAAAHVPPEVIRAQIEAKVAELRAKVRAREAAEEAALAAVMREETREARERFERLLAEDRAAATAHVDGGEPPFPALGPAPADAPPRDREGDAA